MLHARLTRIVASSLLASIVLQAAAGPALAMSTATEISQGKTENAQIDASSIVIDDPFLTSWTNRIGSQLSQNRHRQDITYRFTVLADPSINAFAIKGGYVHVNLGLLNFVSSDDELASILGHEMGHVELRHVVKSSNTSTIIGIITALASILSPIAAVLGSLGGDLVGAKYSRVDELQADKYGVEFMARSGYDPNSAIDVMTKLGQMEPGPAARADKAFLDHPVPADRVSHLLGYGPLDRPSVPMLISEAVHDQTEGRYSYANAKFTGLGTGQNPDVASHVSQLDYALRESGPRAAPDGRVFLVAVAQSDPARTSASQSIARAQSAAVQSVLTAKDQARKAEAELATLQHDLDVLSQGASDGGQGFMNAVDSGATGQKSDMANLAKLINGTLGYVGDVIGTVPGLLEGNKSALREMADPLSDAAPLTPKFQALLPYYPAMTSDVSDSTDAILSSIQMSRDTIAQASTAVALTRMAFAQRRMGPPPTNSLSSPPPLPPPDLRAALAAWSNVLAAALRASNKMYASQAATLSTEITLQDLLSSPERYEAYRQALLYRFPGVEVPDYHAATALHIRTGEMACAAWMSVETSRPMAQVLDGLKGSGKSCEAAALDRGLMAESMEIAIGLMYEDYIDQPQAGHVNSTLSDSAHH